MRQSEYTKTKANCIWWKSALNERASNGVCICSIFQCLGRGNCKNTHRYISYMLCMLCTFCIFAQGRPLYIAHKACATWICGYLEQHTHTQTQSTYERILEPPHIYMYICVLDICRTSARWLFCNASVVIPYGWGAYISGDALSKWQGLTIGGHSYSNMWS